MPTPDHPDRVAADQLNRFWDAEPGASPGGSPGTVHPGGVDLGGDGASVETLAAAVRALQARDNAPAVDPGFAARLRRDLFAATPTGCGREAPNESEPEPIAAGPRSLGFLPVGPRRPWLEVVAAALLLAIVGGGLGGGNVLPGIGSGSPTIAAHEAPAGTPPGGVCAIAPPPAFSRAAGTPHAATPEAGVCR